MVRYVKNEGRPALGFAVESEESDESSDDEPLSDQPSLATLVSENPCRGARRVDGARRVREALLLRSDLVVFGGVEGALLGRSLFAGGRRRRLHDGCFLAGAFFGLGNERRGA